MRKISFVNETNLPLGYEERLHNDMRFGLFVPPNYSTKNKYPFILVLHGKLDTSSWNLPWYNEPIISNDPCIVVTPKTTNPNMAWGNSSNEKHTTEMLNVLEIIILLRKEFNIDENRFYVHGASMGGFGVFNLLVKEPEMFTAAIAVCGGGLPSTANILKGIPLWMFHGDADPIIPVEQSRNIYNAILHSGGTKVRYTEYPNVGHDSWINAWNESSIINWLLAQRKNHKLSIPKPPKNINYEFEDDNIIKLNWEPSKSVNIWYYKVYYNNYKIAESDGIKNFVKVESKSQNFVLSVTAVNYYFEESKKIEIRISGKIT